MTDPDVAGADHRGRPSAPAIGVPRRRRRLALIAGALAATVAGAAGVWMPRPRRPPTAELARLATLAQAGQPDRAEAGLRQLLDERPDAADAHLLLAQLALRREGAAPALEALRHLDQSQPGEGPAHRCAVVATCRGQALLRLRQLARAENTFAEALRREPTAPEAGWGLLEIVYLQGRRDDACRLALRQHEVEPDRRDRVQWLLELVRQDAQVPAPASVVDVLRPAVAADPADLRSTLALGLALVLDSRADDGLAILRRAVADHPGALDPQAALLDGLDEAGRPDELDAAFAALAPEHARSDRLARHRAGVALRRGDLRAAADDYRRALRVEPHEPSLEYRLARVLRALGEADEAARLERRHADRGTARVEVRRLYEEADALPDLGLTPQPDLYRRIAANREALGCRAEALAWQRLILRDDPSDTRARAEVARLRSGS